jgi:HD-like signal output (HDOD) protein/CheY-like chemotaxis protein
MGFQFRTVMVVEDDAQVRTSLSGMIDSLGYRSVPAQDGQQAMERLEGGGVDAVLLDLHMPGANGFAFIREAQRRGSAVPIVAMSGSASVDDLVQLIRLHVSDYLRKPFRPEELATSLETALAAAPAPAGYVAPPGMGATTPVPATAGASPVPAPLRAGNGQGSVSSPAAPVPAHPAHGTPQHGHGSGPGPQQVLAEAGADADPVRRLADALRNGSWELPALSPVAARVQDLFQRPTCAVDDVISVIGGDPAIAGDVLRVANTSYYGGTRAISNLRAACLRLGNRQVLAVAHQVLLRRQYSIEGEPFRSMAEALWRSTVIVAHGAREIARRVGLEDVEDLYVAALLHNVGKLLIMQLVSQLYEVRGQDPSLIAGLPKEIETRHEELGSLLLSSWRMSPRLVRLAKQHHSEPRRPEVEAEKKSRLCVVLAWKAALRSGHGWMPEQEPGSLEETCAELGLEEADVLGIFADASQWAEHVAAGEG